MNKPEPKPGPRGRFTELASAPGWGQMTTFERFYLARLELIKTSHPELTDRFVPGTIEP